MFRWQNIELDEDGEPLDTVLVAPNWTIEILSPDQSSNRVTGNILHCLKYGCQLGWLIDPDDRSILIFQPQQQPELFHQNDKDGRLARLSQGNQDACPRRNQGL